MLNDEAYDLVQSLDSMTFNHSIRVKEIADLVERSLGMKNKKLSCAAFVHDVGKLYIPSNIINKPNRLTDLERDIIDLHPYISYQLLKRIGIEEDICQIALFHHGKHMPCLSPINVKATEEIYEKAKILHSIDMYEALTTDRPYRRGFKHDEALYIMNKEKELHDERVLNILSNLDEVE